MKANGVPKTSVKTILMVERQARAVELRLAGRTLQQIADALGYAAPSGAAQTIEAALRKRIAGAVDDLRQVEYGRLEVMWRPLWSRMLAAMGRGLKIMTRRAKLLGLDVDRPNATDVNPEPIRLIVEKVEPPALADPAA